MPPSQSCSGADPPIVTLRHIYMRVREFCPRRAALCMQNSMHGVMKKEKAASMLPQNRATRELLKP